VWLASEQQERNKINYCAQNLLADEFWGQINENLFVANDLRSFATLRKQ